jgi:Xaa-Pro aminopeptidase
VAAEYNWARFKGKNITVRMIAQKHPCSSLVTPWSEEFERLTGIKAHIEALGVPVCVSINGGMRGCLTTAEAGDYRFQPGDGIRFDLNLTFQYYFSYIARTACVGQPSAKLKAYHTATAAGLAAAKAGIRPGVKASELFRIYSETARAAGIPHFRRNHVGHALEVGCYDLPLIGPMDDTPLEEGIVINREAPVYEVGFGAAHLEDTYLVTATGCRRFAASSRDLFLA